MSRQASAAGAAFRLLDRARRRTAVPVVVCFDVEPDDRVFDPRAPGPWLGFERLVERLPSLRRRLSDATGMPAAFTWTLRMDPQVGETWGSAKWVAETYADVLSELAEAGDELGLHTHLWRWQPDEGGWIADFNDPAWADHCLTSGLDAFVAAFGRPCAAHRGGDHFLSGAMLARLDSRGVKLDLTVEPGLASRGTPDGERSRGPLPEYRGAPTAPYRSSAARFPAPDPAAGGDGPLLVPLLSAPGLRRRRSPLPPWTSPSRFVPRLAAELLREPPRVLALAVRSDAALGPWWDAIESNLEHIARHRRMSFVTASAAYEQLAL